jgi:hypothetical protein
MHAAGMCPGWSTNGISPGRLSPIRRQKMYRTSPPLTLPGLKRPHANLAPGLLIQKTLKTHRRTPSFTKISGPDQTDLARASSVGAPAPVCSFLLRAYGLLFNAVRKTARPRCGSWQFRVGAWQPRSHPRSNPDAWRPVRATRRHAPPTAMCFPRLA